ncbi:hypothetical protein SprV_0200958300 [Sparganum proliferum]
MLLINVCALFLLDFFSNPIHSVVLHFLINLAPGSVEEFAPSIARKVAIRPNLCTIEEVSEEEERAEEVNWDDMYEEEDDEENGLDETALFPHPNTENNSTAQKPPLTDTNVHSERTSLQVERSGVSVAELTVWQPTCPDTAARRRQRRNWKDVSRLSRSVEEFAPSIARKVAIRPNLCTIEEVSEEEERAEEVNWDDMYEEEDDEENGLDETALFPHPNTENNSTAQKPPLTDTNVHSERTSLQVEHSGVLVAELTVWQPTCPDTAARRRQRRNWKNVSRLSLFEDGLLYERSFVHLLSNKNLGFAYSLPPEILLLVQVRTKFLLMDSAPAQ